jgi:hypothetical protein
MVSQHYKPTEIKYRRVEIMYAMINEMSTDAVTYYSYYTLIVEEKNWNDVGDKYQNERWKKVSICCRTYSVALKRRPQTTIEPESIPYCRK